MKCGLRFALGSSVMLLLLLFLVEHQLRDIFEQYSAAAYLVDSLNPYRQAGIEHSGGFLGRLGDKVIVMAKLEEEHTNWVQEELPEYTASSRYLW
jgi:hypothetical protein